MCNDVVWSDGKASHKQCIIQSKRGQRDASKAHHQLLLDRLPDVDTPRRANQTYFKISVILLTHDCVVSKLNNGVKLAFLCGDSDCLLLSLMESGSVREVSLVGSPVRRLTVDLDAQRSSQSIFKANRIIDTAVK